MQYRNSIVVDKIECLKCLSVGNTKQHLKNRVRQHKYDGNEDKYNKTALHRFVKILQIEQKTVNIKIKNTVNCRTV